MTRRAIASAILSSALVLGCDGEFEFDFEGALEDLEAAITIVQEEDPRDVDLPDELEESGETVIINNNVVIIDDIDEDIIVEEVPDLTIVGFENVTGFDIFVRYEADAEPQGIFVFDGETLLLEYPCLLTIEVLTEDDFDPNTGIQVASFDLLDGLFVNPDDFACGEALILTFDPNAFSAITDVIDLAP